MNFEICRKPLRGIGHYAHLMYKVAGAAGIEPTLMVLETTVLPLNYAPELCATVLFFCLLSTRNDLVLGFLLALFFYNHQDMTQTILDGLNPAQAKAVQVLEGPLLILAGAGSGKTKCLTHRIAYLMANGVRASEILAVTFTNKAAGEMKERVEKLLSGFDFFDGRVSTVGTFHSICVRILRADIESLACGIDSNFVIFDTGDMHSLMKSILKERGYDDKQVKYRAVLSHISAAKNELKTPLQYIEDEEDNRFTKIVKEIYPVYQKRLAEHNALDFDDLLQKVVQVFENSTEVLNKYRRRWNHLMIDEYQDTNFAQYRMVRLLSDEHQNICAIGDDHQSIYSFRGGGFYQYS